LARAVRSNNRVDLILLVVCAMLALVARAFPEGMRQPVASGLRRTFMAPMVLLQEWAETSRNAVALVGPRTAVRDSTALRAMTASALDSENDRLRRLIGLGARLKWGFVPAEALHSRGIRDESTVILSAGSRAGVARLSPVIAPEGLVGVVDAVDPTMSHAMLWTHPDFRVSAMSADAAAFGIAQAHLTGATGGYLIELRGVPFRANLKPGALIVSSGLGGVWPRGIPVGTVLGEIKTNEGWARTYLLRPAVFPADVFNVMILRPERVAKGFEGVWPSVASADSAAQRIVVAGDSAAKAAAIAEAAARTAVMDSAHAEAFRPPPIDTTVPVATPRPVRTAPVRRDTAAAPPLIRAHDSVGTPVRPRDSAPRLIRVRDTTRKDSLRRDSVSHTPIPEGR
jgi:rod shape-determining protein MreC